MATPYITDSWSSVSGLAAVAYGSPSFYAEVANQAWRTGITAPVGVSTSSAIAEMVISREQLQDLLELEYDRGEGFADYVDLGTETIEQISKRLHLNLVKAYNELSTYNLPLTRIAEYAWGAETIGINPSTLFNSLPPDSLAYSQVATSLPTNKLDKLPPDSAIPLSDNMPLGEDFRGLDIATSYLTPLQYFSGLAYPGLGLDSLNIPRSITKSIEQGYIGYPTTLPLDELLNSGFSELIGKSDVGGLISGSGTVDMLKGFSPFAQMSQADQAMYEVDLTDLILAKNGYTIYTPGIDSPGNYADLARAPNFSEENNDQDNGLPFSQRTRTVN